jgi:hypothetical protein
MIEADDVLWTWRMPCSPEHVGDVPLSLTKIADHPPPLFDLREAPYKNKTGSVHIADSGRVEITPHTHQSLTINFDGKHLQGQFELTLY